ncbi:unnamed protein product [Anisakis simplex]|uniref:MFS domain-containing protein n=1 Tax=Anisakis simplex TaxID=6269 RepID=A0A0M3JSD8_ANISI|nr:unnamed protein product [Anisakis simplex]
MMEGKAIHSESRSYWWVAVNGFLILLIESGIRPMLVIYFNSFQQELMCSKGTFSTIIAVINAASLISGPVSSFMYRLYGARLNISAGAIMAALGFVLISFSSSIIFIIITALVIGVGCGTIRTAIVSVQCEYFSKNRNFVMAFIFVGPGIGQFLFAQILNRLNNWVRYHYRLTITITILPSPVFLTLRSSTALFDGLASHQ